MRSPYLDHDGLVLYNGDAISVLRELGDETIEMCVTSPPFYNLRDYQTARWEGGDPDCSHKPEWKPRQDRNAGALKSTAGSKLMGAESRGHRDGIYRDSCRRCGAVRFDDQVGLEETPDAYVERLVGIFREVRRVLRPWGVLLLELGDSYNAYNGNRGASESISANTDGGRNEPSRGLTSSDAKPKDLLGMPWLLAFALRADGWWIRGEYIWDKPNPMPESVEDRCTTSHSRIFHFAKAGAATFWTHRDRAGVTGRPTADYRWINPETEEESEHEEPGWRRINLWDGHDYFWDAEAIREEAVAKTLGNWSEKLHTARTTGELSHRTGTYRREYEPARAGRNARSVWAIPTEPSGMGICPACRHFWPRNSPIQHCGVDVVSHFAAFPLALAEKAIRAASSEFGVCPCGAPWTRIVERTTLERHELDPSDPRYRPARYEIGRPNGNEGMRYAETRSLGWRPTCGCDRDPAPSIILDPFAGSATALLAARRIGRNAIGIELNADYCEMAARRLAIPDAVERAAETSTEPTQLLLG